MRKKGLLTIISLSIFSIGLSFLKYNISSKADSVEEYAYIQNAEVQSNTETEEEVIHTHIWATKYDKDKHWEYCTVCDKIRNEEEHTFEDNWFFGYPSCHTSSGDNYSTRICSCGYSYIYHKPHEEISGWRNTGVRMVHYKACTSCGSWTTSGYCSNKKGRLGCNNPGTCTTCGVTATKDWHYITCTSDGKGGKCRDCGKRFFDIEDYSLTYTDDSSAAIIKFTFVPLDDSVEFTGLMGAYCHSPNYTGYKWDYEINDDNSCTYTGTYTFDINRQRKSELLFLDRIGAIKVNGVSLYIDASILKETIWQDHEKSEVEEIVQVDQATSGDWATIKELTIKGTENLANIVILSIKDKETGEVIIDKAKTNVVDGKFVYKCTPAIEGPAEGRDYVLTITDETGNVREHVFTIYRTDSRAPLLKQSEFTEWSRTKHLEIPITDYGSGLAQTSLDNQYTYQDTKFEDGKYYGLYTFSEENYGVDEHLLYLRDGLGNARREKIKVGKIDNTKPTIKRLFTYKEGDGARIEVVGDDYSEKMKAQGSGVVDYAITKSADKDPSSWKQNNVLKVSELGTYYLWIRDRAGNIGDVREIQVSSGGNVIIPDPDNETIIINGDKYMYAYYVFYIKNKKCDYVEASKMTFSIHGEKNNDEKMYMYISSSEDSEWSEDDVDGDTVDKDDLISILNKDSNILSWQVDNTREVSRKDSIYEVRGNNICTLTPPSNLDEFIGSADKKNIYIHVISQSGREYVAKTSAVKRAIFEQH